MLFDFTLSSEISRKRQTLLLYHCYPLTKYGSLQYVFHFLFAIRISFSGQKRLSKVGERKFDFNLAHVPFFQA